MMNICDNEISTCKNGHDNWSNNRLNSADRIYDFTYIARAAIESCIRVIIGNAVSSTPKKVKARCEDETIIFDCGDIQNRTNNRIKSTIAESNDNMQQNLWEI